MKHRHYRLLISCISVLCATQPNQAIHPLLACYPDPTPVVSLAAGYVGTRFLQKQGLLSGEDTDINEAAHRIDHSLSTTALAAPNVSTVLLAILAHATHPPSVLVGALSSHLLEKVIDHLSYPEHLEPEAIVYGAGPDPERPPRPAETANNNPNEVAGLARNERIHHYSKAILAGLFGVCTGCITYALQGYER